MSNKILSYSIHVLLNSSVVVEMRSDKLFIYCQQEERGNKNFVFLITLTPYFIPLHFSIYMIKGIEFRIKNH